MPNRLLTLIFAVLLATACAGGSTKPLAPVAAEPPAALAPPASQAAPAPLFEGMGDFHFATSTRSRQAQRYVDQGMTLAYGFNHNEAARSFAEAARLDPSCALCFWGVALVLGPNINAPMDPAVADQAWAALAAATRLAPSGSERERAFIEALERRYAQEWLADRSGLDREFADAMREVARRFPADDDALTLFAEALMDTMPWDYWRPDGSPKPETEEVLAALSTVLARNPRHPGANHFWIHAVEASRHPERGVEAADRLRDLVPGAGHLVHMPGHIYFRVGRYHDAVVANQKADAADDAYVTQCHAQGAYPLAYHPHNNHFLLAAAAMGGESAVALAAARKTAELVGGDHAHLHGEKDFAALQYYGIAPYFALARFGRWQEILAEPEPAENLVFARGFWHFVRGLALVAGNELSAAERELAAVRAAAADPRIEGWMFWGINHLSALLSVASEVLAGELAARRGDLDGAIAHLEKGVELEAGLRYDEPPPWYLPVRHVLGAVLLEGGRPAEAERVYRQDLEKLPANGWGLHGLAQSLRAQDRAVEAEAVETELRQAWRHADVQPTGSRVR